MDTDPSGQLVMETKGMMETACACWECRSMRQSEELRAFYANKNAMVHKAANDEQLKLYTRAILRDGKTDELPAVFNNILRMAATRAIFVGGLRRLTSLRRTPAQNDN